MKSYEALKKAVKEAGEIFPWTGGTSAECTAYCKEATKKQDAIDELRAYEQVAASLIERAVDVLSGHAVGCAEFHGVKQCADCDIQRRCGVCIILAEMEAM